jgi:hypothetical protein
MCYSALVRQDFHDMARRYGASIALDMFADLFRRRRDGEDIESASMDGAGPAAAGTAHLRVLYRGQERNRPAAATASEHVNPSSIAARL